MQQQQQTRRSAAIQTAGGVTHIVRYRWIVSAPAERTFGALLDAIDRLGYPLEGVGPDAFQVHFFVFGCRMTAEVSAAVASEARLLLEFTSLRWKGIGGSAVVILPGVLLGALMKAQEAFFAWGFRRNVLRTLQGREVGIDSARLPLLPALRSRLEITEP